MLLTPGLAPPLGARLNRRAASDPPPPHISGCFVYVRWLNPGARLNPRVISKPQGYLTHVIIMLLTPGLALHGHMGGCTPPLGHALTPGLSNSCNNDVFGTGVGPLCGAEAPLVAWAPRPSAVFG